MRTRGHIVSVQTFLPYPDFEQSARVLDLKRLGKQRVETIQIVRALTRPTYGWANHPAVLMWKGYEEALGRYGLTCCEVWTERGFGDTCAVTIAADLRSFGIDAIRTQTELAAGEALPPWLGQERVHLSHRSAPRRSSTRSDAAPRTARGDSSGPWRSCASRPSGSDAGAVVPRRGPGRPVGRTRPGRLSATREAGDVDGPRRSPGDRNPVSPPTPPR